MNNLLLPKQPSPRYTMIKRELALFDYLLRFAPGYENKIVDFIMEMDNDQMIYEHCTYSTIYGYFLERLYPGKGYPIRPCDSQYNISFIKDHPRRSVGCYKCNTFFTASDINSYMKYVDDDEENDDEGFLLGTALCPLCQHDTILVALSKKQSVKSEELLTSYITAYYNVFFNPNRVHVVHRDIVHRKYTIESIKIGV